MSDQPRPHQYPGQYTHKGVTYHVGFPLKNLQRIEDEDFLQPHHVVVASYPKSGSTWLRAIVDQILTISRDEAKERSCLADRFPHVEMQYPGKKSLFQDVIENPNVYGIFTHLQSSYFERYLNHPATCPSFVYIMREPKDTLTSCYHFELTLPFIQFTGTFDEYFKSVKNNRLIYGCPIEHIQSWWRYKNHPNICFIKYEDLLQEPFTQIQKLAEFLGYGLSEEEVRLVQEATTMDALRQKGTATFHKDVQIDESKGAFFRKGTTGDWRTIMTSEQSQYIDDKIRQNLQPLGLYTVEEGEQN